MLQIIEAWKELKERVMFGSFNGSIFSVESGEKPEKAPDCGV
ncbi:hypothetical protein [Pseudomonas atacamensis]|nr:hypothetical protein [Pseudomonas atacamensis]WGT35842.1 hypothetical protein QG303_09845 [Pseudomonas atacamensis]